MIRRQHDRGQSLLELLVALGIVLSITSTAFYVASANSAGASGTAEREFAALIAQARALAATTATGATILVGPKACDGAAQAAVGAASRIEACLYPSRPIGTSLTGNATATIELPAEVGIASLGAPPYGIFISPSGLIGAAPYSTSATTLPSEPACSGTLRITFGGGASSGTLDCTDATFSSST